MRRLGVLTLALLFGGVAVLWGAVDARAKGDKNAVAKEVAPVVAEARKAAQGDKKTTAALKAATARLKPFVKDARAAFSGVLPAIWPERGYSNVPPGTARDFRPTIGGRGPKRTGFETFAQVWNELLTVSRYHGMKPKDGYVTMPAVEHHGVRADVPAMDGWWFEWNFGKDNSDQLVGFFRQEHDGKWVRVIKVWRYRWDTTYSGVGGENYKKLARDDFAADRDAMPKQGRKASAKVVPKKLNKHFPRAYHYFIEGNDPDERARVRRSSYYVKTAKTTFNFEVISYLDREGFDAVTSWQAAGDGPEVTAVLQSLQLIGK